jgi:nitrogenase molybdenum-iron protein NifN
MGAQVPIAITTATGNPVLNRVPADELIVGDLGDLEARAVGCDLLVTHSHGRQASGKLGLPLLRVGFPIFDRLGSTHKCTIGYAGTRNLLFEVANLMLEQLHEPTPEALNPFRTAAE